MAASQLLAPELGALSYGAATLQLLDGLGFSSDGKTLLVRATYTDVADGGGALHYGVWTYDLTLQEYVLGVNQLIAGSGGNAADVEVLASQIVGKGDAQIIVAEFATKGSGEESKLALIIGGELQDADYLGTLLGPDISVRIEAFALSNDGRFLALQTDSAMLAPESEPDANDMSDIYLLDLQIQQVQRVSVVGGSEVFSPVHLGNVVSTGEELVIAFSSAASFVVADKNAGAQTIEAQSDAYLWRSAFDDSGLTGSPTFQLLSARPDGSAAGYVLSDVPVLATLGPAFFSSLSAELVASDANGSVDTFFVDGNGQVQRVDLNGYDELSGGAALLSASSNGRFVAMLSSSVDLVGSDGVQQVVVDDLLRDDWNVVSANASGVLADDLVTMGVLSPTGNNIAFTSAATNLGGANPALQGSLFAQATGLAAGVQVDVLAYTWKTHTLLQDVLVGVGDQKEATNAAGQLSLLDVDPSDSVMVSTEWLAPAGEVEKAAQAVNLNDAIAILKMIVGLPVNTNGAALSPYQALAADFDGNGAVQLNDAIAVLKHVVGLTSPEPTWHFVDEASIQVASLTAHPSAPGLPPGVTLDTSSVIDSLHLGLVAFLSGDVDGSYVGPAGAQDLDVIQPQYFADLSAETGLSLTQFGIYA